MLAQVTTHSDPSPASFAPAMARHDGLVQLVVRQQWGGHLPFAQRLQAGRIGLWQALRHFDPTRGYAFSTYAWPTIARQVWREVAQAQAQPVPQEYLTSHPPQPSVDADDVLLQHQVHACLHQMVDLLPTHLHQVVVLYYGLDDQPTHSFRQLGRRLHISHEMARQRLLAALLWLRQPAHSLPLRQLLDRNTVADYRYADTLAQRYLRHRHHRGQHGR